MTNTKAAAAPKKTLASAERQAASDARASKKAAQQLQREHEARERLSKFEAEREVIWLRLWARALQMSILINEETLLETDGSSYWFDNLKVNATPGQEFIEHDSMNQRLTASSLTLESMESATYTIDSIFNARADELQRRENVRIEAERVAKVRAGAIEKLSEEERKILNIH